MAQPNLADTIISDILSSVMEIYKRLLKSNDYGMDVIDVDVCIEFCEDVLQMPELQPLVDILTDEFFEDEDFPVEEEIDMRREETYE